MSSDIAAVLLVRHGQTDDNRDSRFQGQLDTALGDVGREQARRLGEEMAGAGLAALYASPLARALETARLAGECLDLEPRVEPGLAEAQMGAWQGRLKADIEREEPAAWAAWRRAGDSFRFPGGGESLPELQRRMLRALEVVRAGPVPALVVCHGGSIRSALAAAHPRGLLAYHDIEPDNTEVIALPDTVAALA